MIAGLELQKSLRNSHGLPPTREIKDFMSIRMLAHIPAFVMRQLNKKKGCFHPNKFFNRNKN